MDSGSDFRYKARRYHRRRCSNDLRSLLYNVPITPSRSEFLLLHRRIFNPRLCAGPSLTVLGVLNRLRRKPVPRRCRASQPRLLTNNFVTGCTFPLCAVRDSH